jgi:hypothetical protein
VKTSIGQRKTTERRLVDGWVFVVCLTQVSSHGCFPNASPRAK